MEFWGDFINPGPQTSEPTAATATKKPIRRHGFLRDTTVQPRHFHGEASGLGFRDVGSLGSLWSKKDHPAEPYLQGLGFGV